MRRLAGARTGDAGDRRLIARMEAICKGGFFAVHRRLPGNAGEPVGVRPQAAVPRAALPLNPHSLSAI